MNRFEKSGLIVSHKEGNKKIFQVNTKFPLYSELNNIAFKHLGIDQILDKIIYKIGSVEAVYLTGDLARGVDTEIVDISIVANDMRSEYLNRLIKKVEKLISRRIRTLVFSINERDKIEEPRLLIYGDEVLYQKGNK